MEVISIINQKGGVGKSTTAQALSAGLRQKGYRTLVVDLDSQQNTSHTLRTGPGPSIFSVLTGESSADEAVQVTDQGEIIPASLSLASADNVLQKIGKEYRLKEALEPLRDRYDFVIVDTPPSLGILTVNALVASDSIIIPAQTDAYSLQGISSLAETIDTIRKYCNPGLKVEGILMTRHENRTRLSRDLMDYASSFARSMNTKVFNTWIRKTIRVKEAQLLQTSLIEYDPSCSAAVDYTAFIDEFLGERKK